MTERAGARPGTSGTDGDWKRLGVEALHLILLPTEQCNFRCTYCFEDFLLGRMDPAIVRGVERLLTARAPLLEQLTLQWYGGEPLLARDIVERVQAHALELVRRRPGLQMYGALTTNGYLLRRGVLERLVRLGVKHYQVSFDGPREQHDRQRVLAGGQGTFVRIWDNLIQAREIRDGFELVVRVHINRDNREFLPRFLESFQEAFGADDRFAVLLRPVARLGGRGDRCEAVLPEPEASHESLRIRDLARQIGVRQLSTDGAALPCYAALPTVLVVRPDGSLAKCTVALSHAANRIGQLREDGTVAIDGEALRAWMRGLFTGDPSALACPARDLTGRP